MHMSHTAIFYYVKYKQKSVILYFILTYFNIKYEIKSLFFDDSTFMQNNEIKKQTIYINQILH